MSQLSKDDARRRRSESLDTIAVKNITSEDFILWYDKLGPSRTRVLVPKAQKDIGHGKGINHLPRYMAKRFTESLIIQIINKEADAQLKKIRDENRRMLKDERLEIEKNNVVRTNDQTMWEELAPKIFLGVVEKYGGDDIPDPLEVKVPESGNPMTDTMKKIDLGNKVYEPETKSP